MVAPSRFDDTTIQKLFGHEAAEDEDPERLREYYFKSYTFDQVTSDLPLRILVGHKGIGKSALFKVAMAEEKEKDNLTILIQPNDISSLSVETSDFLVTIRQWIDGLSEIITRKVFSSFGISDQGAIANIKNQGGMIVDLLVDTFKKIENIDLNPTRSRIRDEFLKTHKVIVYIDDLDRGWQGRRE